MLSGYLLILFLLYSMNRSIFVGHWKMFQHKMIFSNCPDYLHFGVNHGWFDQVLIFGHSGCFSWLLLSSTAMKIGVHASFWITGFSGYMPSSGFAESHDSSMSNSLRNRHIGLLEKEMAAHSSTLAGESHGQRSLAGYCPWGRRSQTRLSD